MHLCLLFTTVNPGRAEAWIRKIKPHRMHDEAVGSSLSTSATHVIVRRVVPRTLHSKLPNKKKGNE